MVRKKSESRGRRGVERPCPICGQPVTAEAYPFCSSRCAKVDLNRWLSGVYVIPAKEEDEEAEEPPPEPRAADPVAAARKAGKRA